VRFSAPRILPIPNRHNSLRLCSLKATSIERLIRQKIVKPFAATTKLLASSFHPLFSHLVFLFRVFIGKAINSRSRSLSFGVTLQANSDFHSRYQT
jgi:hypothetical protein